MAPHASTGNQPQPTPPAPPPPPSARPRVAAIAGFGVGGISAAVARRLGDRGYALALLARRPDRLGEGAAALRARGAEARGYAVDLADSAGVRRCLARVAEDMGPVEVLHWNPYNR